MNIVLHDYFESAEGGGRLSLILARELDAELAYGMRTPNHPFLSDPQLAPSRQHNLTALTQIPGWRQLRLARAFSQKTQFLVNYRTVIYSGSYTPLAIRNHRCGRNILYCHTPPRFIYDQRGFYLAYMAPWQRPILLALIRYLKPRYEAAVSAMDTVIANSANVRERIKRYLGKEAVVIHPPCQTEKFQWLGQEDFYLSTARLDPLKRVETVVEAFQQMPDKRLVVISGGPESAAIRKQTRTNPNINVMGWVQEATLKELYGKCIATIYIPKDEDFGMSPVESMAAGKPVIGVAEGGLLETVIQDETGFLLPPNPAVEQVVAAVRRMTPQTAAGMRARCENRARQFDVRVFIEKMRFFL